MIHHGNQTTSLRKNLIRGAIGSLFLKFGQIGFGFIMSVLLSRFLGVEGFGSYAFCISIVNLLVIPAMFGCQPLLVREITTYYSRMQFHYMSGLLHWVRKISYSVSFGLSLFAGIIAFNIIQPTQLRNVFILSIFLVPLLVIVNLQGATLRGFNHTLLGQISLTFMPLIFSILLLLCYFYFSNTITPTLAIILNGLSHITLILVVGFIIFIKVPSEIKKVKPSYETRRWLSSMFPFFIASLMHAFNNEISVILLGVMKGTELSGLFRVAQRGSDLISFGLLATNIAIAPTVAKLYAEGDKKRLQNIISKSTLLIASLAFLIAFILICSGKKLIPLIFGHEYALSYVPLVILSLGQFCNSYVGSVGQILNMVNLEKIVTLGVTISAIINICLNLLLIPIFGLNGAALASAISISIRNIFLSVLLFRKTGIISVFCFGVLKRNKYSLSKIRKTL